MAPKLNYRLLALLGLIIFFQLAAMAISSISSNFDEFIKEGKRTGKPAPKPGFSSLNATTNLTDRKLNFSSAGMNLTFYTTPFTELQRAERSNGENKPETPKFNLTKGEKQTKGMKQNNTGGRSSLPQLNDLNEFKMDTDDEYGEVVCIAIFDPYLGSKKRYNIFDRIREDYTAYVSDRDFKQIKDGGNPAYVFETELNVVSAEEGFIKIPSPSPDAWILDYSVEWDGAKPEIKFYKDGADNYYVWIGGSGSGKLRLKMATDEKYFSQNFPRISIDDLPKYPIPENVRKKAMLVASRIGIDPNERRLDVVLNRLIDYFSSFKCGDIPESEDEYLAIALSQNGACRHRAMAFFITANSLGIPARLVTNECHAFVEVFVGDGWRIIDLGGCDSSKLLNAEDKKPFEVKSYGKTQESPSSVGGKTQQPGAESSKKEDRKTQNAGFDLFVTAQGGKKELKVNITDTINLNVTVISKDGFNRPVMVKAGSEWRSGIPDFKEVFRVHASSLGRGKHRIEVVAKSDNAEKRKCVNVTVMVPTEIKITSISSEIVERGDRVFLNGQIYPKNGFIRENMENLPVYIYLKRNKTENGTMVGAGFTSQGGYFSIPVNTSEIDPGEYHVIAEFPGYDYFLPSKTDPKLKITDRTRIEIDTPRKVTINQSLRVVFRLLDSQGNGLSDRELKVSLIHHGYKEYSLRTDENGSAEIQYVPVSTGNITVQAEFGGDDYYRPSSSNVIVNVTRVKIEVFTSSSCLNGEISFKGRVTESGTPLSTNVTITFAGKNLTTISNQNGNFTLNFTEIIQPGSYEVAYSAEGVEVRKPIVVVSRTEISAEVEDGYVIARLIDSSLNQPIPDEVLRVGELELRTNQSGYVRAEVHGFSTDIVYEGSEYYLPAKVSITHYPIHLFFISGALPFAFITAYVAKRKGLVRMRTFKAPSLIQKQEQKTIENGRIAIIFPQISKEFPDIWGVGEDFEIVATCRELEGEPEIYVEDRFVGRGKATVKFDRKGEYNVRARLGYAESTRKVKVVNYAEEIVNIFREFSKRFDENLTAREIGKIVGETRMIEIFEKANYTLRQVSRADFEEFYRRYTLVRTRMEECERNGGEG